jgi:hypothetical protein
MSAESPGDSDLHVDLHSLNICLGYKFVRKRDYNPNKGSHGLRSVSGLGFPMALPDWPRCQPNRREIGLTG